MLRLCAVLALSVFMATAAVAGQEDSRLEGLFKRLQATESHGEAQLIELLIVRIWTEAGDAAADTLMQLGTAAMQKGDLTGALSLFDAVTARKPDFAEGWNKRATVLFLMGAYEKSTDDVARVLELEPRHFGALAGLGYINVKREREDAAIAAFEQALKVNPHLREVKDTLEELRKKKAKGAI